MKVPYSFREAEKICGEARHLVGTFSEQLDATIEAVIVTPFDQHNKQRFFLYYHLFDRDAQSALSHEYTGHLYDVVVITRNADNELSFEDLCKLNCDDNSICEHQCNHVLFKNILLVE